MLTSSRRLAGRLPARLARRCSSRPDEAAIITSLRADPGLLDRVLATGGTQLRKQLLESGFKRSSSHEVLSAADAFVKADLDGDGKLTAAEFHQWYQRSLRRHGHSMSDPDIAYKLRNVSAGVAAVVTETEPAPPTARQLRALSVTAAVPFIAFGFLDNAIMLAAGDQIEAAFGATLGLSAMAAAGLGNMCSDVVGIQAGSIVEAASGRMGLPEHKLTPVQMLSARVKRVVTLAQMIGISIGCIFGLAPLLFMDDEEAKTIKKVFKLMDTDRSGLISLSELEAGVTQLGIEFGRKSLMRIYDEIDADRDRQISLAEFKELARGWKEGVMAGKPEPGAAS